MPRYLVQNWGPGLSAAAAGLDMSHGNSYGKVKSKTSSLLYVHTISGIAWFHINHSDMHI